MDNHRIFKMAFASVYPHYVTKAEKKGRTQAEVDQVICWLTGYTPKAPAAQIKDRKDFETFFNEAPALIRVFKAVFGEPPHQYRVRAQIERAKHLLILTDRSVTDIC